MKILESIILATITAGGFALTILLIKGLIASLKEEMKMGLSSLEKRQTEMNGSVKDVISRHHECRETLPERFASNDAVKELLKEIGPIRIDVALIKKEIKLKMKEVRGG